jgi:hypothetical protein
MGGRERTTTGRGGKNESRRKMDECGAERKRQRHGQARENEKIRESRYNREYKRCVTEDVSVYRERESAREREK